MYVGGGLQTQNLFNMAFQYPILKLLCIPVLEVVTVGLYVFQYVTRGHEAFLTQGTAVRALSRVDSLVDFQRACISELPSACGALVGLLSRVSSNVLLQSARFSEFILTDFTVEWLFPCVDSEVPPQATPVWECFVACCAFKWPQPCVLHLMLF